MAKAERFEGRIIVLLNTEEAGYLKTIIGCYTGGILYDLYDTMDHIESIPDKDGDVYISDNVIRKKRNG